MPKTILSFKKTFQEPDERRDFEAHGHMDLLSFEGGATIGLGVFEPGWRWETDVKPIAKTKSCEASHSGYCLEGTLAIRMDSGEEFHIRKGDAFHIPAGHDAWVEGQAVCKILDFTGYAEYAKPQSHQERDKTLKSA